MVRPGRSRRTFLAGSLAVFGWYRYANAQAKRVPRVGVVFLHARGDAAGTEDENALVEAFRSKGYVDGTNVVLERRYLGGRMELYPDQVADLVARPVDVLVVSTRPGARAAVRATSTIPIVVYSAGDPVAAGFAATYARPGGNLTGVTTHSVSLAPKRLELLKSAVPKLKRVASLTIGKGARSLEEWHDYQRNEDEAARRLGLSIQRIETLDTDNIHESLDKAAKIRPDGVLIEGSSTFFLNRREVGRFLLVNRLPAVSAGREYVMEGALLAYWQPEDYERVASLVDQILRGAKPARLPIELAAKYFLSVNLKTAKALGIILPRSLLQQADHVVPAE